MLPIVIYTQKRIFKYYTGFSFFLFIWISRLEGNKERLIRHEKIHFYQQLELLFVFHWVLYVLFYLVSRIKGHKHYIAYRYNPFELEAYYYDSSAGYLRTRSPFNWMRFVKKYKATLNADMTHALPKSKEIGW